MARWISRLGQGLAAVLGILLLAAAGGLLLATQTAAGRSAAADLLEGVVAGAVDGSVEVGPITGGNLFTRALVDRFAIHGPDGELFLELRDVRVEYSPLGFVTGSYRMRRMTAGRLEVRLLQDDGGTWNFERIFEGGEAEGDDGDGGIELAASDVTVEDGRLEVRTPWTDGGGGARRARRAAGAAAGEEVWNLERTDGGVERVIAAEELGGRLPLVRLAHPREPMRVEMEGVEALVRAVRQPLRLERLDAAVTLADTVRVDLDRVRSVDGTSLSGRGRVVPADPPRYRFGLEADRVAFSDLRWLPVPVPDIGGGSGDLVVRSSQRDPEVLVVEVSGGDFRSGESRVTGDLGVRLTETPRLEGVDVRLRPLRLGLAHELLGRTGAPDGYVEGRVSGGGPLDLFRLDADVSLRPLEGGEPSGLRVRGGLDVTGDTQRFDGLRLGFDDFAPRWTRLVGIDTRQSGRVGGELTLDRARAGRVGFSADLAHRVQGDTASRVTGRGEFDPADGAVDLSVAAEPLSLSVLDPFFPAVEMVGVVRGPISASGTLSDLQAGADLQTPRGQIEFEGRFDLAAERKAYDARLTARGIQLRQWFRRGPRSNLDVRGSVEGRGTDPATLRASFDLEVLPSRVEGASVDSSLLRFTVEQGLARIDTFAIRTDVGTLRGRGGFGLSADRSASVLLSLEAPDLSRWNRWIVPGRGPSPPDTTPRDLFAAFPEAAEGDGEGQGVASPDTLAGSLAAQGAVFGNVEVFGVGGNLTGRGIRWGETSADTLRLVMDATDARSLDSLVLTGRVRDLAHGGQGADSVAFRLQRTGARSADVGVTAWRAGGSVASEGAVEWTAARKAVDLSELSVRMGEQSLRLARSSRIVYGDSGLVVRDFLMEGGAGERIRVDGEVPRRGAADLTVGVDGIDLANARRLTGLDAELRGRVQARLRVQGTSASPRMQATVRVDSPGVGARRYAALEAEAGYADRRVDLETAVRGSTGPLVRVAGAVGADLSFRSVERRLLEDALDLRVSSDSLPLDLLLAPVGSLRDARGWAVLDVRVRGSPGSPSLDGEGEIRAGAFYALPLGISLRRVRGRLTFEGSEIQVDSLGLASGEEGTGEVTGTVDLASPTNPEFDLEVRMRDLRVIDRRKASMLADGEGRLEGSYRRPTLTGRFRLSDGSVRAEDFLREDEVVDLTDPELYSLVDTMALAERRLLARIRNPFVQNLRAHLTLLIGPDLWLRARNLDVELAGEVDLRMDRAQSDVTVFGSVRLVRGNYRWTAAGEVLGRQLRITEGRIEFVGTPGMNPNLDITAAHRVRAELGTITVRAHITGTVAEPQLALTSEPPLPESDRACVLLINAPCTAAGPRGQLVAEAVLGRVGSELTSVLTGGSGPDYITVQTAAGARAGLGDDDEPGGGTLLGDKEVELGWYLSPEVFLTLTQPLGRRTPAFSLDWRFAEDWTLEFRSEHLFAGGLSQSTSSNLDEQRLWGLFLFREWSF